MKNIKVNRLIYLWGGLLGIFGVCLPMAIQCRGSGWSLSLPLGLFLPFAILAECIGIYLWVVTKNIDATDKHKESNYSNQSKRPSSNGSVL
jgi:hypothetical protein